MADVVYSSTNTACAMPTTSGVRVSPTRTTARLCGTKKGLGVGVCEGVCDGVAVMDPVEEGGGVREGVCVAVFVGEGVPERDALLLAAAVPVDEEVGLVV